MPFLTGKWYGTTKGGRIEEIFSDSNVSGRFTVTQTKDFFESLRKRILLASFPHPKSN